MFYITYTFATTIPLNRSLLYVVYTKEVKTLLCIIIIWVIYFNSDLFWTRRLIFKPNVFHYDDEEEDNGNYRSLIDYEKVGK